MAAIRKRPQHGLYRELGHSQRAFPSQQLGREILAEEISTLSQSRSLEIPNLKP